MALQRIGEVDRAGLRQITTTWAGDPHPLVRRAAVAGGCEPRLLRTPEDAAHALDLCARVTESLAAVPADRRRDEEVRVLRLALGYCWSVAVAADPTAGLPAFLALDVSGDPDVLWVTRENRKKARLARLLS